MIQSELKIDDKYLRSASVGSNPVIINDEFPCITLDNGIRIVNFSSFHGYRFVTGEYLDACTKEVADKYKMHGDHLEEMCNSLHDIDINWLDMNIVYTITDDIKEALNGIAKAEDDAIDIILVPYIVVDTIKRDMDEALTNVGRSNAEVYLSRAAIARIRTCKKVDVRDISIGIYSDKFCAIDFFHSK